MKEKDMPANELDQYDLECLANFISQNWGNFITFMEMEHESDEDQCNALFNRLEKAAGIGQS
jgi:hypothetical protein